MSGVVDADTHIAESESMWEYLPKEFYRRRPVLVTIPDNTLYSHHNAFWLIDGNIFPKPAGKGGFNLITPSIQSSIRKDIDTPRLEIIDTEARIADMD